MKVGKIIKSFLWLILFVLPANAAGLDDKSLLLRTKDPVQGINIEVVWLPDTLMNGYVIGPAIIRLINAEHKTSSTVVNNYFFIKAERLDGAIEWGTEKDGEKELKSVIKKEVVLDYKDPVIAQGAYEFGTEEEPFFFYDINFDGKKDFIVGEFRTGQRFRNKFKVYELDDDQDMEVLKEAFQQITNNEPFIDLDSASTVNNANKTISVSISAGAADSYEEIYTITADGFTKISTR